VSFAKRADLSIGDPVHHAVVMEDVAGLHSRLLIFDF